MGASGKRRLADGSCTRRIPPANSAGSACRCHPWFFTLTGALSFILIIAGMARRE
jgi:hypothetical protein